MIIDVQLLIIVINKREVIRFGRFEISGKRHQTCDTSKKGEHWDLSPLTYEINQLELMLFCQRRVAVARVIPQNKRRRHTSKHGIVFIHDRWCEWRGRREKIYTNLVNSLSRLFEPKKESNVSWDVRACDDVNVFWCHRDNS